MGVGRRATGVERQQRSAALDACCAPPHTHAHLNACVCAGHICHPGSRGGKQQRSAALDACCAPPHTHAHLNACVCAGHICHPGSRGGIQQRSAGTCCGTCAHFDASVCAGHICHSGIRGAKGGSLLVGSSAAGVADVASADARVEVRTGVGRRATGVERADLCWLPPRLPGWQMWPAQTHALRCAQVWGELQQVPQQRSAALDACCAPPHTCAHLNACVCAGHICHPGSRGANQQRSAGTCCSSPHTCAHLNACVCAGHICHPGSRGGNQQRSALGACCHTHAHLDASVYTERRGHICHPGSRGANQQRSAALGACCALAPHMCAPRASQNRRREAQHERLDLPSAPARRGQVMQSFCSFSLRRWPHLPSRQPRSQPAESRRLLLRAAPHPCAPQRVRLHRATRPHLPPRPSDTRPSSARPPSRRPHHLLGQDTTPTIIRYVDASPAEINNKILSFKDRMY